MKKIYASIFTALLFNVTQAQLTLTKVANEPVVGDVLNNVGHDSTTAIPKNTGTGQSWNFSSLTNNSFTETVTYTTVAASPNATDFPNATLAAQRGGTDWEFWRATAPMLEYAGNASNTNKAVFSNYGTWLQWPSSYATTASDPFVAAATQGTNTGSWNGNVSYTITGTGTVTLPGGAVHNNCLQLKRNITLTVSVGGSTTQLVMIHYDYFSSATKFPIVNIEYQTATTGTVVNKNFSAFVNAVALPSGLNESNASAPSLNIYPNPASDMVFVSFGDKETAASIEIIDMNGRVVKSAENSGIIRVADIAKGLYSLRVITNAAVLVKPLVITE